MEKAKTALVLGATGGIGGAIAGALLRHGWQVRGLARNVTAARKQHPEIEWIAGDAMVRSAVVSAATGASAIVHGVNPPNYANWDKLVLPMIDNTITAARARGARILLPGTVYNFDPRKTPVLDADTKQQPTSRKGAIRMQLEQHLQDAAPEVRSVILRAGDFFGPGTRSSWFSQAMVKPGQPAFRVTQVARSGGHSWAYLPDLAEVAARLLEREAEMLPFERVQFAGYVDETGRGMIDAVSRAVGREVKVSQFPWWVMQLAAPFGGFPREAAEIAQFWRYPLRFDNRRLEALIGPEPHTALDEAVSASLGALGSLPEGRSSAVPTASGTQG